MSDMTATAAADLERDEQHEEQKPETTSGDSEKQKNEMSVSEPELPAKLDDLPDTPPKSSDTEDLNLTLDCTTDDDGWETMQKIKQDLRAAKQKIASLEEEIACLETQTKEQSKRCPAAQKDDQKVGQASVMEGEAKEQSEKCPAAQNDDQKVGQASVMEGEAKEQSEKCPAAQKDDQKVGQASVMEGEAKNKTAAAGSPENSDENEVKEVTVMETPAKMEDKPDFDIIYENIKNPGPKSPVYRVSDDEQEMFEPPPPTIPPASKLSRRKRSATPGKIKTCAHGRSPRSELPLNTRLIECTYMCPDCRVFFHKRQKQRKEGQK